MAATSKRLFGPAQLSTSATTIYTAPGVSVMQRGRVSNPTGSVQTFTMSMGADAAGTRIYSATPILPGQGLDIWGPFTLGQGDILQAYGSSASLVLELSGVESSDVTYSTNFPNNEFTTGPWLLGQQTGVVWTDPTTSLGTAYGTQSVGSGDTDDSLGILNLPISPNAYASAIIYEDPTLGGNTFEVELLFRCALSANSFTGYECNLAYDGGYAQIVRLNGALNDYTYVSSGGSVPQRPVTGDLFEAQIVGNIITMWLTHSSVRTQINQADVTSIGGTTYTTGLAGVGFWHGNNQRRYGFTQYTVQGI